MMLGQFGVARNQVDWPNSPPELAGNEFSTDITKIGNDYFVYHNDEFFHSGIHRWKITGLNTIKEVNIFVTL